MLAVTSRSTVQTNLESLLDTFSKTAECNSNEIQLISLPEGTYVGNNIDIKHMSLELSGDPSIKRSSLGTHILLQFESYSFPNKEKVTLHDFESCIFSLTNSTLSLDSLRFSLICNSEELGTQMHQARSFRLAVVSGSMLTISGSRIDVSSMTSAILISPSKLEESSLHSSVVMTKCSISNDIGQLRGIVETASFPTSGGSRSISLVECSFNSQAILGTDGIGLSLTRTARKRNAEVGMISSSLISCSFVNMSSIGSSRQPHVSELSQRMLGCVVRLSSSHLSGSTIRDVNNGGSVLCSNSSFSSLLSSPNPDSNPSPSVILPDGSTDEFKDDTPYIFTDTSGVESSLASFSHCHFTGAKFTSNKRALTFTNYPGTIKIISCSFTDHTLDDIIPNFFAGMVSVLQQDESAQQPVTVQLSNFTNLKSAISVAGMSLILRKSATVTDCKCEECGPEGADELMSVGGIFIEVEGRDSFSTVSNLVFESCHAIDGCGGMSLSTNGAILLSDCRFEDCSIPDSGSSAGGLNLALNGQTATHVTRLTFTDCQSAFSGAGMNLIAFCDLIVTDSHFIRCQCSSEQGGTRGGGFSSLLWGTFTVNDCSFVDCSNNFIGAAFDIERFKHCVVEDCIVKNCYSGTTGAISFRQFGDHPSSISLTRVAFINNSIGQHTELFPHWSLPEDTATFVDISLNYHECETKPTFSIVDCFTTYATTSIGMHMKVNPNTPEESYDRVIDEAFDTVWPLLTERVKFSFNPQSGRMELGITGKTPTASQKYEVTIRNEGNKTEMKEEVEFVDGKGTLISPSPSFNLDFSTSYTITSIVGIVSSSSSSSSSLSNALTFPQAAWAFNLTVTPSFVSFTTPEQPPTLVGATAHLVSSNQPLAFILLILDRVVNGSYSFVVAEGGKDVSVSVHFDGSTVTGESSEIIVVGSDRLLTHDTTYTIKAIVPTPETESPFVWMNKTITFHIPKSSFDPKKAMSEATKKLLSWLIPVIASVCVVVIVIIVIIVLVYRRRSKENRPKSEIEEQDAVEMEKAAEGVGADSVSVVGSAVSANCGVSEMSGDLIGNASTMNQTGAEDVELTEVMMCSGGFGVSTGRMGQTLYSVLHEERREIGKRWIGIQIVNGLKEVVAHRGWSDVLTHLSSHWIVIDNSGNVELKLRMNAWEAEQEAARQRPPQQPLSSVEGKHDDANKREDEKPTLKSGANKSGMDGLRWRAPEVVASEGGSGEVCVDGSKASVFSLGLILWEIETGQVPFGELDAVNAQRQSGTGIGPKMGSLKDESFVSLIHRCVSVDPNDRPSLSEIGEFLSSHPEDTLHRSGQDMNGSSQ
ncbi:hypothetical protein BLNAU_11056 [Blattamonas nauphoetae]|uniref:Protein kinase domain-containing protein n=1 Tax=Blattamonas nauphoetae TaxID=2049346 RepID=A0ABQ9XQU4_9EUKA|nr:hypothetical protein BLNAU_11056 [Blattamonas nauphoetae]